MKKLSILFLIFSVFIGFLYSDYTQEIKKTFDSKEIKRLHVENVNGSLKVKSWDKPEIYVYVKKTSKSKSILEKTDVVFEVLSGELKIKVKKRDGWKFFRGSFAKVEIEVMTPFKKDLSLSTVNGSIYVENMEGKLSVSTVNGGVWISNHRGIIDLETVNGGLTLKEISGSLRAETVNGNIFIGLKEIVDRVNLSAVNGSITVEAEGLDNTEVKAETVNGSVSMGEFEKPVRALTVKNRSVYFVTGDGSKKVRIETVNGSVKLFSKGKII